MDAKADFEKAVKLDENDVESYRYLKYIAFRYNDNANYKIYSEKYNELKSQ